MPSERTCKTCRWWDVCPEGEWDMPNTPMGVCRIRSTERDTFPCRYGREWCGEWTDRPMPAAKNPDRGSMFYRDEP